MAPKCTYCGGTQFLEGPSGGMSINILCATPSCRHWFNYTAITGELEDLKRIEPTELEHELEWVKKEREHEEYVRSCYNQGGAACRQGTSLRDLFESGTGWHQVTGADLHRIAGYLEELRGMIKKGET